MVEWQGLDTICGVEASNINASHLPTMLHYTPAGAPLSLFPPDATWESILETAARLQTSANASCNVGRPSPMKRGPSVMEVSDAKSGVKASSTGLY